MQKNTENAAVETEATTATTEAAETTAPKSRKLVRTIEGTVVKLTEATTNIELSYDFASLPADIQAKLGPYGLNQKLGDAAAGKSGQEAVDAIKKVWDALIAGDWTHRQPAQPKYTVADVKNQMAAMSTEEQEAVRKLMAKIGVNL